MITKASRLFVGLMLASAAFGLFSCALVESSSDTTKTGYAYTMFHDEPGKTVQVGDRIQFTREIRLGRDSVLSPAFMSVTVVPDTIQLPRPFPADYELLMLMSPGDSAEVLVFGERMEAIPNAIYGPEDTLIYRIRMEKILQTREERENSPDREAEIARMVEESAKAYNSGKLASILQTTASGLQYIFHRAGEGPQPRVDDKVEVHYYGALVDGKPFDSSFKRKEPIVFQLGARQVIQGWEEGIGYMNEGGAATFFIPATLAYGSIGSPPNIPPDATLIFYVELQRVIR